jgi:hypothetical protein
MPHTARRTSVAARRFGYIVAVAINVALWFIINIWPGWRELSFVTAEASQVVGLLNLSLVVGVVVNLAFVVVDSPWLKVIGDLTTTGVGLVVLVQVFRVFPFDFESYSINWALVARLAIVAAIVGSVIGLLVQLGSLIRLALDDAPDEALHR